MKTHSRRAFTMSQLLVILVILAILFALLLPAVQKVREAAARSQSSNNIRQIAIALHNYHDATGALPPGNDENNFSCTTYLLPYIEQDPLFKNIDMKKPSTDPPNAEARKVKIKIYLSPLDMRDSVTGDWGATNYLFNAGSGMALKDNDGIFYQDSKSRIPGTFQDGTSNTIMVVETLKGDGGKQAMDLRRQHVGLKQDALDGLKEESGVKDWADGKNILGDRCASWMDGRFLYGTFNSGRKVNDPRPDVSCEGFGGLAGPRTYGTVVMVGLGDASIRAVSTKISEATWKAAITPAANDLLGTDW